MDGNFVDNNIDNIIESAGILPQIYSDSSEAGALLKNKYDDFTIKVKFNAALNPEVVNDKSASITTDGNKVGAHIKYDENEKSILIRPKKKYSRNKLYILKISGSLMTDKGKSLRKHMYYAFKQSGSKLDFYRGFTGFESNAPDKLPASRHYYLPALFLFSAAVLVASYLYKNGMGLLIGTGLVMFATFAAMVESVSDFGKSQKEYLYGAKLYNQGFFFEAVECFERALHHDPSNLYAKYALDAAIIKSSKGGA